MKRIGILTHYYKSKNIGGLLQAYALTRFLTDQGMCAQQISFDFLLLNSVARSIYKQLFPRKITFIKLFQYPFRIFNSYLQTIRNKTIVNQVHFQNFVFEEFEHFISHSVEKYTDDNITQANERYEVFITGSDQVFCTCFLSHLAYYGEFTTPDKKFIAYAASSSTRQFIPYAQKLFIQKLSRLNAISVREKTLKEYIERITPYKATVVLDPTFLLSPQEWLKIANPTTLPQKPYIFCYFLGGKSAWQRKIAQAYADKYGYEVVHLPYIMGTLRLADRFLKGQSRYDVGPREFIALINGAQCVFTDSFHGLAFSINFGKNFYVFNRDDQAGPLSMNARITDTLATFGLTQRHVTNKNTVLDNIPLDFTHAHQVLAREKELSINWLLNALKD